MRIRSGKIESAQKVLIYGPEGVGKSTLAALFEDPLFIDVEGSTKHMDVKRLDAPSSWTMLLEEIAFVILHPDCCRTLVIDTADWAEYLCISHVCTKAQVGGIEDFGYGKGYTYLAEEFGNMLNRLSDVIEKGIHVVLTAHSTIRKFEQPDEAAAYDRWELKLQKKTAPLVREWSDMVLFANYRTFAVKSEGTKTAKPQGGERTLYTSHRPAYDAKNRHDLPDEMPFEDGKGKPVMPAELKAAIPVIAIRAAAAVTPTASAMADEAEAVGVGAPETPGPVGVPPHLTRLYDLMAADSVTDVEVRQAVFHKSYFPVETPIDKYPADFVDAVLVASWPKVLETVKELRTVPFK